MIRTSLTLDLYREYQTLRWPRLKIWILGRSLWKFHIHDSGWYHSLGICWIVGLDGNGGSWGSVRMGVGWGRVSQSRNVLGAEAATAI